MKLDKEDGAMQASSLIYAMRSDLVKNLTNHLFLLKMDKGMTLVVRLKSSTSTLFPEGM